MVLRLRLSATQAALSHPHLFLCYLLRASGRVPQTFLWDGYAGGGDGRVPSRARSMPRNPSRLVFCLRLRPASRWDAYISLAAAAAWGCILSDDAGCSYASHLPPCTPALAAPHVSLSSPSPLRFPAPSSLIFSTSLIFAVWTRLGLGVGSCASFVALGRWRCRPATRVPRAQCSLAQRRITGRVSSELSIYLEALREGGGGAGIYLPPSTSRWHTHARAAAFLSTADGAGLTTPRICRLKFLIVLPLLSSHCHLPQPLNTPEY
ncbi:hypothetical protein B0H16DRAFT_292151 [Mycena metata]|uniref:Uncharacterized protein n=1 Tax=Mycena metata TaxID=1033252 RepID=A0AAD7KGK2_9AGAR|nr:hypothetical protein B0H16DRAFT_292151 [Mycena metata]